MAQILAKAQLLDYRRNPDGDIVHEELIELDNKLAPREPVLVYNCEEYVFNTISPDKKYLYVIYTGEEIIF